MMPFLSPLAQGLMGLTLKDKLRPVSLHLLDTPLPNGRNFAKQNLKPASDSALHADDKPPRCPNPGLDSPVISRYLIRPPQPPHSPSAFFVLKFPLYLIHNVCICDLFVLFNILFSLLLNTILIYPFSPHTLWVKSFDVYKWLTSEVFAALHTLGRNCAESGEELILLITSRSRIANLQRLGDS